MNPLDFISDPPNLYILHKEKNKTNFGGILFLIYLVIIIIILVYYIIDYVKNDKYVIQSFNHFNYYSEEKKKELDENEFLNPYINFKLNLFIELNKELYDLMDIFVLYDNKESKIIQKNTFFKKRISEFDILILYECDEKNCSDYYELLERLKIINDNKNLSDSILKFTHDSFQLQHQNEDKPILKTEDNNMAITRTYYLNINETSKIKHQWRNILYTEKKGFFQKDSNDSCGYIENFNIYTYKQRFGELSEKRGKNITIICEITFSNDYIQYTQYFRKKISLLDVAANVLSLIANIFTGIRFILKFYSGNFNNFKIIEKILNKKAIKKYKPDVNLEMNDLENNKFITIKDDLQEKCIDKGGNENNFNETKEEDDKSSINTRRIKKLRFFDFFLNNLYCCFKKQKNQNIIYTCNQIVCNYASIDNLIKNQILMENLMKDYKWNDPSLNNVENNNLFIQLKTYL